MQKKTSDILSQQKILVIAHSFETGPPQELVKFLRTRAAVTTYIDHPFFYAKDTRSSMTIYESALKGKTKHCFRMRGPEFFYYIKDLILTIYLAFKSKQKYDICVACDNLNAFSALLLKKLGRVRKVVYSAVDFTPKRFDNYFLNKIYHFINKVCCYNSDLIWNSADGMVHGRELTGISKKKSSPQIVTPDGNNFDDITRHTINEIARKDLVFMGHLRKNQGVPFLIDAMPEIVKHVPDARLVVVGSGPLIDDLKHQAKELGLSDRVIFKGFVKEHADVERILAKCAVAVAPYVPNKDSFSYYSDVGKPKAYMACALPIIITPVPQISFEIAEKKAGILIQFDKKELVDAAVKLLKDDDAYVEHRQNAIKLAENYKWDNIFLKAFEESFDIMGISRKDKLKVLVTVPGLLPPATRMAGLRIIYELYKRVAKNKNLEVHILTSIFRFIEEDYPQWMKDQAKEHGLKFFIVNGNVYENNIFEFLKSKLSFVRKARKLNKEYKFDVIHDYSSAPIIFLFSFFYKKIIKGKVIHTLCTSNKGRLASFRFNWGIRYIDRVVCASRHISSELKKHLPKKYKERVLYTSLGVDLDRFENKRNEDVLRKKFQISPEKKVVLYVGPLGERKGALVLTEALVNILGNRSDVEFVFVAYGKNGLDNQHEENKFNFLNMLGDHKKYVHLMEGSCDIPSLLVSTDIFVLPAITSHGILAQPLTLLEAMAVSKPVVASKIDGVEEIIEHGKNGLLFKNKDSDDLAKQICTLLDDGALSLALAKRATVDVFENYDILSSAKSIADLYETISREF